MKRRILQSIIVCSLLILAMGCGHKEGQTCEKMATYFTYPPEYDASGVRRIPISTPVGNFEVWTQRFGSNAKVKVLLLHGGPAYDA